MLDRGLLQPGYKADINVIDWDELGLLPPTIEYDLPGETIAKRLMQKATGYKHTICSGVEVSRDGVHTGELPGTLIRGARPLPAGATSELGITAMQSSKL